MFKSEDTLRQMLETQAEISPYYGLGVQVLPTPLGTYIGHIGFSGAFMFYWQEQDLVITGSVNQTKFDVTEMVLRLSQPLIAK